jgi:ABC-type phosphate/phosphonate transport system substrate-binding protein
MYPFAALRSSYDRYWTAVHGIASEVPSRLDWELDLRESWTSPDLVVAQTCGWPLITHLAAGPEPLVRVVGAFEPMVEGAEGHRYRSVLVAREHRDIGGFAGTRAAVNSADSLSGWVSLLAATAGSEGTWNGPVIWTGAHLESVRAVHEQRAEVASIDSVSWAHIRRWFPELADELVEVGFGPLVPTLPVITRGSASDELLEALRTALIGAFDDPSARSAMSEALMGAFVPLDLDAYAPLLNLMPPSGVDQASRASGVLPR